ncbi:hypothetical protein A1OK_04030 [Enterovibrio norvegicus FF-454]|uniref:DUF2860 domain-containing protein n=1 Tax=Enterovibrio norvegicus FF-454 TaxID=1185651 RepID=A0A1E5C100_9GAMM|nr:DUF2860 domain-containing protein [Enterovibrio norvegicus]OEE59188.1 hypothetical protein A1OK_04030 [Enterovibrio norvegicus FF-454]
MNVKHTLLTSLIVLPFFANAGLAERGGLSGEISLLGGVVSTDSNLSTSGEAIKNAPLNSSGNRETNPIFGPLGSLAFTWGEGLSQQIFVGTTREDIAVGTVALEIGYKQELASGTKVTVAYLPTVLSEEVWSNPYLTDTARSETDKSGNAYRLQLNSIGGSPLSIDIAYAQTEIDDEQSGTAGFTLSEQSQLNREGDTLYSKVSYRQFLGRGLGIAPAFVYYDHEAEGDAMSYQSLGGELSYFSFAGRNKIVLTGKYHARDYDANHPVFGTTRADKEYGAFLAYEYGELFDVTPLSLISLAGYNNIDSNIDFYNASQYLFSLGVNYKF